MKFAFSTAAFGKWTLATIAASAKEWGACGVELAAIPDDPGKVAEILQASGIEVACLNSGIAMSGSHRDVQLAQQVKQHIDAAKQMGCPLVKVRDRLVRRGEMPALVGVALGDWLADLGDYAAAQGVKIVVHNALSFVTAAQMWQVLDRINHPAVAACWDVLLAAGVGESPFVSVPVLNSRIGYVQVSDAKVSQAGLTPAKLGDGDVAVAKLLTRLQGIGYKGYVTMAWDPAWAGVGAPETQIQEGLAKLQQWSKPPVAPAPKKPAPPAPAAPTVPKEPAPVA